MENQINVLIASRYDKDQRKIYYSLSKHGIFNIVSIENNDIDAIIKSERLNPDILILDLQLTLDNGIDIIKIVRRRAPSTAIIILSNKDDDEKSIIGPVEIYASIAFKLGICGFLLKEEDIDHLDSIIKLIISGKKFINATLTSNVFNNLSLLSQFPGQVINIDSNIFTYTELAIITGIAKGYSDIEISKELNLHLGSIRNCITEIKRKTCLNTRVEIVIYSLVYGIIRLDNIDIWKKLKAIAYRKKESRTLGQFQLS